MPIVKLVHNVETGIAEEVELTAEELVQYEADAQAEAERLAKEAEKAAKRAEILERLGLTEDEAKLILS